MKIYFRKSLNLNVCMLVPKATPEELKTGTRKKLPINESLLLKTLTEKYSQKQIISNQIKNLLFILLHDRTYRQLLYRTNV
jgi:hypothetical protein